MVRRITLAFALSLSTVLACGGSQPPANPPTGDANGSAPKEAAADGGAPAAVGTGDAPVTPTPAKPEGFKALSQDKKVEIMATKVVPNVGKEFKDHDSAKFGKFGCKTCHGSSTKNDPHDVLPKLTFSNGGYDKLAKAKPDMMKFMADKVVPAMAAAMGEKPADPTAKQGFNCSGCHKVD